jgi:hypothetical protein
MPDNLNNLHVDGTPIRRPLAHRIAQELRHLHPSWTEDEIVTEAKAQAIAQLRGRERATMCKELMSNTTIEKPLGQRKEMTDECNCGAP